VLTETNHLSACRCASDILSVATFKKVVKEGNYDFFKRHVDRLLEYKSDIKGSTAKDIVREAYQLLCLNYRVEYFYKNTILNTLLSDSRFAKDSVVVFNEFKVNKSIADVVFINGRNRVYEIKTELDSPERLYSQLSDYKKVFSEVTIVTHWSLFDKYSKLVIDEAIGLLVLDKNFKLVEKKAAQIDTSKLEVEVMLKCLRKNEICSIVKQLTGTLPSVSNMAFFDECLTTLSQYDIKIIQKRVFTSLKSRGIKEKSLLLSSETLEELKYICLTLDFTVDEYRQLYNFLKSTYKTFYD
jgi:hypothetical protein